MADQAVVDDAWRAWREEVAFAEKFVADSSDLGLRVPMRDGTTVALREVLVHMIESMPATAATLSCPMEVTVQDGRVTWLQGNTHDQALGASLCAKGKAGLFAGG